MGIVIPRPQMRSKERRTIEANLKRHYELTTEFKALGMSLAEASKAALEKLQDENRND